MNMRADLRRCATARTSWWSRRTRGPSIRVWSSLSSSDTPPTSQSLTAGDSWPTGSTLPMGRRARNCTPRCMISGAVRSRCYLRLARREHGRGHHASRSGLVAGRAAQSVAQGGQHPERSRRDGLERHCLLLMARRLWARPPASRHACPIMRDLVEAGRRILGSRLHLMGQRIG